MLSLFRARFPTVNIDGLAAGVDLSGWQAPSIWRTLDWVEWSCAKVTEGSNFTELGAIDHSAVALTRRIPWGLYHFAKFGSSAAEAERYLAGCRTVERNVGRLPDFHMLDLEAPAPGDVTAWSEDWCQRVEDEIGRPVVIYTGPSWGNSHLNRPGTGLERRPLWVAHYANAGTTAPWIPGLWDDWAIWQWSSSTQLGSLDVNVARPAFMTLVGSATPAPPPAAPAAQPPGENIVKVWQITDGPQRGSLLLVDGVQTRLVVWPSGVQSFPQLEAVFRELARKGIVTLHDDGALFHSITGVEAELLRRATL